MRKQLVSISIILAFLFLNSCAVVPIIGGGAALGCGAYEEVGRKNEPCPLIKEIDKEIEENWKIQWPWADKK